MENVYLRELDDISFYLTHNRDISGVDIVKDKYNQIYLEGPATFAGDDFDYLLGKRNEGVLSLEMLYGAGPIVYGYFSFAGEWDYAARTVTLTIGSSGPYEAFNKLMDKELKNFGSSTSFRYDSEIYNVWGVGSYQENYENFVTCSANPDPPEWVYGKIYNGLTQWSNGSKSGDSDVAVTHNGSKWLSISPGNDSEPGVGDGAFRWLKTNDSTASPVVPPMTTIGQERAPFDFSEEDDATKAEFDDVNQRWYRGGCTAAEYTNQTRGFGLFDIIRAILKGTDFSLAEDFLYHASSIDQRYAETVLVNTENWESMALSEAISIVEMLFKVEWRLDGFKLTFKHWSQLNQPWKGVYIDAHDFEDRSDIRGFKNGAEQDVFEHRLKFSSSPSEEFQDSVIVYDNDFDKSNTLKSDFDVDFQYATNKKGRNSPVLLLAPNDIDTDDRSFVPSLLHERFYLVDREFKTGKLNGVEVDLVQSYNERAEFENDSSLDIDRIDFDFNCLLKYGLGRFESVRFNPASNKYKISVAIQAPYI